MVEGTMGSGNKAHPLALATVALALGQIHA